MFISSLFSPRAPRQRKGRTRPRQSPRVGRGGKRLTFEQLEGRTLLASWIAASVADLIADINAANLAGGSNTIELVAGKTFTLTARNNSTDGGNGLPVIAAKNNLTIQGNGDTIAQARRQARPISACSMWRFGASLTLVDVTMQGGYAYGGRGGAILNQGALTLGAATVTGNVACGKNAFRSGWGGFVRTGMGEGGGIYSSGSLTLEAGSLIVGNRAFDESWYGVDTVGLGLRGGNGLGGGVYVAAGAATLTNVTLSGNVVQGGQGGPGVLGRGGVGGNGYGGALYVAGGTITLTGVTLSSNSAVGGNGGGQTGAGGNGYGGALYVAAGTVAASGDTLLSNSAAGGTGAGSRSGTSGNGGNGYGGGLYAAGGTVTLRNDTVSGNSAQGGAGGSGGARNGLAGLAKGGGLYIDLAATVSLDTFTLSHTKDNKPDDIYGSYILI